MRRNILILAALLLWPGVAFGADWENCSTGIADGTVGHRDSRCSDPVTGDLDSPILAVAQCENWDCRYNSDRSGTGTNTTCQIMGCVEATASTNTCSPVGNITLTGTYPDDIINGGGEHWIYVNCTGDPVAETPRVLCHCNP